MTAQVVIHIDDVGMQSVLMSGDVEVFTVCELSPNDRVYKHGNYYELPELTKIIGNSPIGSAEDGRHAALAARINGETFKIIEGDKP